MSISRPFAVMAAVIFAAFELGVYIAKLSGASSRFLDWLGGGLAIAFLVGMLALVARARLADGGARPVAHRYLRESTVLADTLGVPVRISTLVIRRDGDTAMATARVAGSSATGSGEVALLRTSGSWRVTGGSLQTGDVGVSLPPREG